MLSSAQRRRLGERATRTLRMPRDGKLAGSCSNLQSPRTHKRRKSTERKQVSVRPNTEPKGKRLSGKEGQLLCFKYTQGDCEADASCGILLNVAVSNKTGVNWVTGFRAFIWKTETLYFSKGLQGSKLEGRLEYDRDHYHRGRNRCNARTRGVGCTRRGIHEYGGRILRKAYLFSNLQQTS